MDAGLPNAAQGYYYALATLDADGAGPAPETLYLAGRLSADARHILAQWTGEAWEMVLTPEALMGSPVRMVSFDDGSGPALYLCGSVLALHRNNYSDARLLRYDGREWSVVPGLDDAGCRALAVLDDGSGPALFLGGRIRLSGLNQRTSVAKWDGRSWTPLGTEVWDDYVYALAAVDHDGPGGESPVIYAGGNIASPFNSIAAWSGGRWQPLGTGISARSPGAGPIRTLIAFDDGSGPSLYVGGWFDSAGGIDCNGLARWDGQNWSLPFGATFNRPDPVPSVAAMTVFDFDGAGPEPDRLSVAGRFVTIGGTFAWNIAQLADGRWLPLGVSPNSQVTCVHAVEPGANPHLRRGVYAGGYFSAVGGRGVEGIALWEGDAWRSLTPGIGLRPTAMNSFGDFGEEALYVAGPDLTSGLRSKVVRWDGLAWAVTGDAAFTFSVPLGSAGHIRGLVKFDDGKGERLYAAGVFDAVGGRPATHLARWDGRAWEPVVTPWGAQGTQVFAIASWDDGAENALYVSGVLDDLGLGAVVYRWNGHSWRTIHKPTWHGVHVLTAGAKGPAGFLYAAGSVANKTQSLYGVGRWNGHGWELLGDMVRTGFSGSHVLALAACPANHGEDVVISGSFTGLLAFPVASPARWDGETWVPLGSGVTGGSAMSMTLFDEVGPGEKPAALYVGGYFTSVDYKPIAHFARWACGDVRSCEADCDPATGPGVLDVFDYLCFQSRFDIGDPYACDCDASTGAGVCDVLDYLCYQNRFVAGCP